MYVHKPPVHIRFDEIAFVNFARGTMKMNRSFDFEIETRSKTTYVFSNIERYGNYISKVISNNHAANHIVISCSGKFKLRMCDYWCNVT